MHQKIPLNEHSKIINDTRTVREIAKDYGVSPVTISNIFKKHGCARGNYSNRATYRGNEYWPDELDSNQILGIFRSTQPIFEIAEQYNIPPGLVLKIKSRKVCAELTENAERGLYVPRD